MDKYFKINFKTFCHKVLIIRLKLRKRLTSSKLHQIHREHLDIVSYTYSYKNTNFVKNILTLNFKTKTYIKSAKTRNFAKT